MNILETLMKREQKTEEKKDEFEKIKTGNGQDGYFFAKKCFELIVYVETGKGIVHFSCNSPKFPEIIRRSDLLTIEEVKFYTEKAKTVLACNKHKIAQKAILLYKNKGLDDSLNLFLLDILDM